MIVITDKPSYQCNHHSGTSGDRSFGSSIKIVLGDFSHERELHMGVRIDSTGNDKLISGINHFESRWSWDGLGDLAETGKFGLFQADIGLFRPFRPTYTILPSLTSTSDLNMASSLTIVPFLISRDILNILVL